MVKIWAKLLKNDKIIKNMEFEKDEEFDVDNFFDYLAEICHSFDLSTPLLLAKHVHHFVAFNRATFIASDFTEDFPFDYLILEDTSNA